MLYLHEKSELNMTAKKSPLIQLNDVELTLSSDAGPVEILRGVDLHVGHGETVGIVGPSGSGKTSLLMILAGLERATKGSVRLGDATFDGLSEDALARVRGETIGIVFQDFHLIPNMTALENVALPLELSGRNDPFPRAEEALVEVGLGHRLTHSRVNYQVASNSVSRWRVRWRQSQPSFSQTSQQEILMAKLARRSWI